MSLQTKALKRAAVSSPAAGVATTPARATPLEVVATLDQGGLDMVRGAALFGAPGTSVMQP
jgi:hypothetical protein